MYEGGNISRLLLPISLILSSIMVETAQSSYYVASYDNSNIQAARRGIAAVDWDTSDPLYLQEDEPNIVANGQKKGKKSEKTAQAEQVELVDSWEGSYIHLFGNFNYELFVYSPLPRDPSQAKAMRYGLGITFEKLYKYENSTLLGIEWVLGSVDINQSLSYTSAAFSSKIGLANNQFMPFFTFGLVSGFYTDIKNRAMVGSSLGLRLGTGLAIRMTKKWSMQFIYNMDILAQQLSNVGVANKVRISVGYKF